MNRKLCISALLVLGVLLASEPFSGSRPKESEILVSAAISLKNAFEEIGALYEKRTGVKVRFNLGASGLLQKQIESGAPVDVFASAAQKQMDELFSRGLILADTRRIFTHNALVLIIPADSKLRIRSFADLVRPEAARIAIGNPKTVPAGQYAREALENLKLWKQIQSRLILAENVRQVLDYVSRGETEAGIVYASDISTAHGRVAVAAYAPKDSHSPISYPIAVIKETKERKNARRFIDLTLSAEGQAVLKKYGFMGSQ
ncbi:MAG: molybdate ABC transporter substrate-binding protein [Acidobacteria bacterium]|nr:molybdate ABC transporter substrate-binding protein [Acidobacteriota bacterium]